MFGHRIALAAAIIAVPAAAHVRAHTVASNPPAHGAFASTARVSTPAVRASTAAATASTLAAPVPMVVNVEWLAQHYRDADVVLLHVGDKKEYAKEHIAGARYIDFDDISVPNDMTDDNQLMLELPAAQTLRANLQKFGISDKTHVVVYFGGDWFTPATRLVHTLNFIGLGAQTSYVDGGLDAWKRAAHPVTDAVPAPAAPGTLTARPTNDVTVTGDWVLSHLHKPGIAIVDARSKNYFDGTGSSSTKRKGHIPGAHSLSFEEIANDNLMLYDKATLAKKFAAAGIAQGDTVIAYCHVGQQATAVVFAARLLGYPVKLYDGSFEDWNKHTAWPVENPAAKTGGL